jgi:hypothetical protein
MPYKDPYQQYLRNIKYEIENAEKVQEYEKEWRERNKALTKKLNDTYRLNNLEKLKAYDRERYKKPERKNQQKLSLEKYREKEKERLRHKKYYEKHLDKARKYYWLHRDKWLSPNQELKKQAFQILGNKCSNPECAVPGGMADIRALQIDHINGGGKQELIAIHSTGIYKKIIAGEIKEYQILCANCNWIKRREQEKQRGNEKKLIWANKTPENSSYPQN